jgi:uncharacterized protein (DUF488 family)
MTYPFFTIGHSTGSITEFVGLLKRAEVSLVVDVRTLPRSRTDPQYNFDTLPIALAAFQIGYEHISELGGRRTKQRDNASNMNAFWVSQSFHNYADYATTEAFRTGLAKLRDLGHQHRCAIMCSEAVWWRCHRRIITDYLLNEGERVFHILGAGQPRLAVKAPEAKRNTNGTLIYPAASGRKITDLAS